MHSRLTTAMRQFVRNVGIRKANREVIGSLTRLLDTSARITLVYQMGRVGSITLFETLRNSFPTEPIYHVHLLNPDNVDRALAIRRAQNARGPVRSMEISKVLIPELQARRHCRKWRIVTSFRDPIARNLSMFTLDIERYAPGLASRYVRGKLTSKAIVETFLDRYDHQIPIEWFERELKAVFGIDLYRQPFPHEQGYMIVRDGDIEVLVLKLEDMKTCARAALERFVGAPVAQLMHAHKTTSTLYNDVVKAARLPDPYLDLMYKSQYARHFYRPKEIQAFRDKWSCVLHPRYD